MRPKARANEGGFTLLELIVVMALLGGFLLMVSGLLISSFRLADQQRENTHRRGASRFGIDRLASELAGSGARIPPETAFSLVDTVNNSTDGARADLGTDTLGILRSRTGTITPVIGGNNPLQLLFHTSDVTVCPDATACKAAFEGLHGEVGDLLLIAKGPNSMLVEMTSITASLAAPSGIFVGWNLTHQYGAATPPFPGDEVTGVLARSFRIMNENLEMKQGTFAGPEEFLVLAEDIEDLQVGYLMRDGTYVNNGFPGPTNLMGATVSLVGISPEDRSLPESTFFRPAVEDHAAGTVLDRRRRVLHREIILSRNLAR